MRRLLSGASLAFRFYVVGSVRLDVATAGLRHWPARSRLRFLASKPRALLMTSFGRPSTVVVGRVRVRVDSLADIGTLQASLGDVHDDLVGPGLVRTARPVVVDVGANVGQFATAIRAFWPAADVLAFEPNPDLRGILGDNARRLGGVHTSALALGAAAGTLPLHRHALSSMSTLVPGRVEHYDPDDVVEVRVARLDDVTTHLPSVDLLKIDVEGFEVDVLRGAGEILRRTGLLLVEVSLGRTDAPTEPEVLAIVAAVCPGARVIRRGRPIGGEAHPICQDLLVDLSGGSSPDVP